MNDLKTSRVTVRFYQAEYDRLREDADIASLTVAEVVRRRCFGKKISANVDMVVLKELRRIGGLLKHVHVESKGAYSAETSAALATLRGYMEKLSRDS